MRMTCNEIANTNNTTALIDAFSHTLECQKGRMFQNLKPCKTILQAKLEMYINSTLVDPNKQEHLKECLQQVNANALIHVLLLPSECKRDGYSTSGTTQGRHNYETQGEIARGMGAAGQHTKV